ncbi:MAG: hypothetical protein GVY16_06335 [Planctomycetes bacterium]|nr:hypothetical protein [Planctomycetota bacterium]
MRTRRITPPSGEGDAVYGYDFVRPLSATDGTAMAGYEELWDVEIVTPDPEREGKGTGYLKEATTASATTRPAWLSSGYSILNRTIECWRAVGGCGTIHVERDLGHGRMDIRQSIN